ncbi:MAG: type II secretion system F family protein [Anaerovoracaceae bacterium]
MKARELSEFAMQSALLLGAGITPESGFAVMAEDSESNKQKDMLQGMATDLEMGESLEEAMRKTGEFPDYMVEMAGAGFATGTLEEVMNSLSDYYAREHRISVIIKNALTYPIIMVFMLMIVLFVITGKVMPVFESVYRQLGTELSPITKQAVFIGNVFSGCVIAVIAVAVVVTGLMAFFCKKSRNMLWSEKILSVIKEKSNIASAMAKRRVAAVLSLSLRSGMKLEEGIEMAGRMVSMPKIKKSLENCKEELELGMNMSEALKETGLFNAMDMQFINVGNRAGKLETVFKELEIKYENLVNDAVDNFISRFEPTLVIFLAVVVGMILMSVMMPLVGIIASIGI